MNPSDLSRHRVAAMLACLSTLGALGGLCGAPALAGPVRIAAAPGAAAPLSANDSVRLGTTTFRNLVPLAMLEQQADEQYAYLLAAARLDKHLLNDKQAPLPQVRAIATKLVPYALKWNDRSRQWHWEVNVVRARQIDAFCFPGGKILLTTGMIERLKLSDDEIAMLLGHEIAHALREHARGGLGQREAEQLARHTSPQWFGLPGLGAQPLAIGTQLLAAGYSRDDETEADVIGTEIAARAGYDPRAAISLWLKLDKLNRVERLPFLRARPYDERRIADLRKHMRDMLSLYARAIKTPLAQLPPYRGLGYTVAAPKKRRRAHPAGTASPGNPASAASGASPANPASAANGANGASPVSGASAVSAVSPASAASTASPVTPANPISPASPASPASPIIPASQ